MPLDLPPAAVSALLAGGGLAVVLLGALLMRLHAVVVLVVATLAVMWLTPRENVVRAEAETTAERFRIRAVGEAIQPGVWIFNDSAFPPPSVGDQLDAYRPGLGGGLGDAVATLQRDYGNGYDWKFPRQIDGDAS
ncbi:MAG: hypothetical protein AAF907_15585, partial [Planctomycetota bacterium]